MKATGVGPFLALAIAVGLLTACIAVAAKDDRAEVRAQPAHQKQVLEGHEGIQLYKVTLEVSLDMGRSYRRPEDTEARETYERLLPDDGDRNAAAIKARARLAGLPQPGPTMIPLVSVADGSVRVLKTLPSTDPQNVRRLTVLEGMPGWVWCMVHPRWCL